MPDFREAIDLGTALVLCLPFALIAGRDAWRSYAALLIVWLAWCTFIILTKDYEPWYFGIIIDGLAARFLLTRPSSRMKAVIGGTYCIEIAMHVAYGIAKLTNGEPNVDVYADRLNILAWLQLLIVGTWAGGNIGGRILRYWHPRPDRFDPSHSAYRGDRR